jgi:hypothetical protein
MKTLQEIFNRDEILSPSPQLINENFRFSPQAIPALAKYKIVHQEVRLIESPLYLVRKYFLSSSTPNEIPLQITISLAWDGFSDALDFLFGFCEALDLLFSPEKLIDTRKHAIGDFGVAWNWVADEINILAFVRNNVFIGIQGFLAREKMFSAVTALDDELKKLATTNHYLENQPDFFAKIRTENKTMSIPAGERLDIGTQTPGNHTFFFINSDGSMNRAAARPDLWYFRAGHELGNQKIDLFRVDEGILPQKESLSITVVKA